MNTCEYSLANLLGTLIWTVVFENEIMSYLIIIESHIFMIIYVSITAINNF
jgi:hypothetical protein